MRTVQDMQPGDRFLWDGRRWTVVQPITFDGDADGGDAKFAIVTCQADGAARAESICFERADTLPEPSEA